MPNIRPIQRDILECLKTDKAGLVFEGMILPYRLWGYSWKQIDASLQKLLRRGILIRVPGTQHCYKEKK